jgi:GRIP domain
LWSDTRGGWRLPQAKPVDMEYLKNVIIRFFELPPAESAALLPVVATMLKLSQKEQEHCRAALLRQQATLDNGGEVDHADLRESDVAPRDGLAVRCRQTTHQALLRRQQAVWAAAVCVIVELREGYLRGIGC